ncbi:hypothetical protein HK098_006222 [Nowakowskiella sp. JEL0407]|nr:hypothetical protein HK098_006222 [Nowakowskiella sp. JEL0407]
MLDEDLLGNISGVKGAPADGGASSGGMVDFLVLRGRTVSRRERRLRLRIWAEGGGFTPSSADDIFKQFFGSSFGGGRGFPDFMDLDDDSLGRGGMPGMKGMGGGMPGGFHSFAQQSRAANRFQFKEPFHLKHPVQTEKLITVTLKPGWKAGTKVKFAGEGDEISPGVSQDLEFVIEEKKDERYARDGDNLRRTVEISLVEALTGFTKRIDTLDNRQLEIKGGYDKVVQPDEEIVVRNEGMPISKLPGKKGDLYLKIKVKFPTTLPESQKQGLKKLLS